MKIKSFFYLLLTTLLLSGCNQGGNFKYLKVGTGSQVGVYYTAGLAIADFVNQDEKEHGIDLAVEATAGSVFNINALLAGELDLAFAQADRQYQAFYGIALWDQNPQKNLRFICSLHPEMLTLLAADDSGIDSLNDLNGKVVSIGTPGSGTRGNVEDCLSVVGIDPSNDFYAEGLEVTNASLMLQDERIDAFFYTVGHPNGSITEATNGKRKVHLVPIEGMDSLIEQQPFYSKATIAKAFYPEATNAEDIATIGTYTTLLTTSDNTEKTIYQITKTIVENFETLKSRHPSLQSLKKEDLVKAQFAPFHPGAEKYLKEVGLLQ